MNLPTRLGSKEMPHVTASSQIVAGAIRDHDVAGILADLVSIPSVNPMHASSLDPPYGEAAVADYVERFARDEGLSCDRQEVLPGRSNVLVQLDGAEPDRRVV